MHCRLWPFRIILYWCSAGATFCPTCKTVTPGITVTCCGAGAMFFQRCEIAALSLTIDYRPRRVNVAALRAGSFVEVRALDDHLLCLDFVPGPAVAAALL